MVDLATFELDKTCIDIVEKIFPNIHQQENKTVNEWALSHLNCKDYEESYKNYLKILEYQNNFNVDMKKFLEGIRTYLKQLTQCGDDKKIDPLLRGYLSMIVYLYNDGRDANYQIQHLSNERLSNQFPEKIEDLKVKIKSSGNDINNEIGEFRSRINEINESISTFQKSLVIVIDNSIISLKGRCPKEEQLTYTYGIKSFSLRCKHFVLRSAIYSRLQSRFRISR